MNKIFRPEAALTGALAIILFESLLLAASGNVDAVRGAGEIDAVAALLKGKTDAFTTIKNLEEIRKKGNNREDFLGKYAQYVFDAFLPAKSDSFPALLKNTDQIPPTDTAFPCAFRWRIVSLPGADYPFFEYWAGFAFRKKFKLVFPGVREHIRGEAWLRFRDRKPQSPATANLIEQMADRVDSAWCTIHLDLIDTKISTYEYLLRRINGIYDSITVKKDLSKYNAISLRCLSRGLFMKPEGTSTAYIVFDRSARDLFPRDPRLAAPATKPDNTVRFTLTMRCGLDVQEEAEAKLLSILRAF
jgi:hypothetical protein